MKRILLLLAISFAGFTLLANTAEARRFGGGSSIGKQRTMSPQTTQKAPAQAPAPTTAPNATTTPAATPAPQTGNRWLGPLAGLAIGAGLGALFMGGGAGGMGGAIGSVLLIAAVIFGVMVLISMFRRSQQPAMQYAGHGNGAGQPEPQPYPASAAPVAAASIPADFPLEAFLRSAKMSFIRLQAANDRKDLNDVREYTTPEMFAEISMQFQERGNVAQTTEVMSINTELLEVVNENGHAIASVRMSGQLRENNDAPESFDEVWHVQKNLQDPKAVWLLYGIQQLS